ncbi:MAG: UbiD family decarboxylase, partial [Rhodospirillaceae bacterium]|nr:UbiD family decarboxylase [Rhodospirillaceae bacterium]
REYMEHAKDIWEELDLPRLIPQSPWHGYSLGAWHEVWDAAAARAAAGEYMENGTISQGLQRPGVKPETRFNPDTGEPD